MKPDQKGSPGSQKNTKATSRKSKGFTDEEKSAMRERVKELKVETEGEGAVLAKIATFPEPDRTMAKRVHAIIKASAPSLSFRTWYGMPAYCKDSDRVVCFFQNASKFKVRYSTLGFSDSANLDEGKMWPVTYALKELTAAEEARIAALVKKAVS